MKKLLENYQVEDFAANESFINYYFQLDEYDTVFWKKWIDQHPEKIEVINEAILVIEFLSLSLSDKEYKQERVKIKNITDKSICRPNKPFVEWGNKNFSFDGYYRAMPFLIICLATISYAIYYFSHNAIFINNKNTEVFNKGKNTLDVVLKDSTIVVLAPGSLLGYSNSYARENREVYLKGEAKFNVKRNEKMPFKVYTNNIIATVLGTVFNIRNTEDSGCMVELLKGKLKVELQGKSKKINDSIFLEPSENAVYDHHNNHFYKTIGTTRVNVEFNQDSFEAISMKMKNLFGVQLINLSDKKQWRFTAHFKNSSKEEIIENIKGVKKLKSKTVGDTIFLQNEK